MGVSYGGGYRAVGYLNLIVLLRKTQTFIICSLTFRRALLGKTLQIVLLVVLKLLKQLEISVFEKKPIEIQIIMSLTSKKKIRYIILIVSKLSWSNSTWGSHFQNNLLSWNLSEISRRILTYNSSQSISYFKTHKPF